MAVTDPGVFAVQLREGIGVLANDDLLVVVLDDTYSFSDEDETLADVVDHEVSGGSYARESLTATVERFDEVWVAIPDSTPTFDLTGITRGGVLVALDRGDDEYCPLVRWFPDPGGPVGSYSPSWPDGLLTHQIAASGVQSVTGEAVDNTDPANPTVTVEHRLSWTLTDDLPVDVGDLADVGTTRILITQDGTGGWTVTWPSAVKWPGGDATISTDPDAVSLVQATTFDGGLTWHAVVLGVDFEEAT